MENEIKRSKKQSKAQKPRFRLFSLNLSRSQAYQMIPFILFLSLCAVLYISNRHYAEKTELKVKELKKELKEYRAEYLTIKSELMYKSKQSEVAKMVDTLGLQELTEPPEKLVIDE